MKLIVEIADKYTGKGAASALLYTPLSLDAEYQKTRVYEIEGEGDLESFARNTLFDSFSQELHLDEEFIHDNAAFVLDYGMKAGALDLEKEAILNAKPEGVESLKITQRIYFFGEDVSTEPFVRDIVNPAIHRHQIHNNLTAA